MEKIIVNYKSGDKSYCCEDGKSPHFTLETEEQNGRTTVALDAKMPITVDKLQIFLPYSFSQQQRIFVNGYQSWTDSREYFIDEKMNGLSRFAEKYIHNPLVKKIGLGKSGDYFICDYPREKGVFYGFSYGYVRNGKDIVIFGSLSERSGFTIIRFDVPRSRIVIEKDLAGVVFNGRNTVADFAVISGEYDAAFDRYFDMMNVRSLQNEQKCGYTTWYNYYGGVTEEIVFRDLEALSALDEKVDIFQIDDGYQKAIGDWLDTKEKKFPSGMKKIADAIHKKNMLAGLWLAPFSVTRQSSVYKEHREWLISDEKGKPYVAGHNWGSFYAIDFYNKDAAQYIKNFFSVILNDWGFDMVKLDFLYAACVLPIHNKTRGEVMCDAMDFLRDCVGDKMILGCGVPLMPAFGKVDFCRVGADVALNWNCRKYTIREDVSTPNTVNCTIFRRHLDNRAFLNDPDVFLLRDNNINLSFEQRKLLAKINSIFGKLLFVSDNVNDYSREQMSVFLDTIRKKDVKIISAEYIEKDIINIEYICNGEKTQLRFNSETGIVC